MAERFERPEVDPAKDTPWPHREDEVREQVLSGGRTRRCSMCSRPVTVELLAGCPVCGDPEEMAA